jgi:hypothetical protein
MRYYHHLVEGLKLDMQQGSTNNISVNKIIAKSCSDEGNYFKISETKPWLKVL